MHIKDSRHGQHHCDNLLKLNRDQKTKNELLVALIKNNNYFI